MRVRGLGERVVRDLSPALPKWEGSLPGDGFGDFPRLTKWEWGAGLCAGGKVRLAGSILEEGALNPCLSERILKEMRVVYRKREVQKASLDSCPVLCLASRF